MAKKWILVAILVILTNAPLGLSGQQRLDGSIDGRVLDSEGYPLPGVSVALEGASIPNDRKYITTQSGLFRFPSLPPGNDYSLTLELRGFKTVSRKGLQVNVGKTTSLSIVMEMGKLEEEVTVVGFSPIVDIKSSKTAVHFSRSFIDNIPMSRDLYDVLNSMPSAVSEDASYRRTSFISGGTVRGNQYSIDGVSINDPAVMYPMTNINIDVYEEVEFGLFGHTADVGIADGGFINIVTKSGGNVFHGGATVEYFNRHMRTNTMSSEDLRALGLEKPIGRGSWKDFSLYSGGPLLRDRIWFFVNGRFFAWTQDFNLVSWDDTISTGERIFECEEGPHEEINAFGKLTFQMTPHIRLTAMYNLANINEDFYTYRVSSQMDKTATSRWDDEKGHTLSVQLNWVPNQNLFADFRAGYNRRYFPLPFSDYALSDAPLYWDRYWEMYRNNTWFEETYTRSRLNPTVTATLFVDNFLGLSHEFKIGIEYEWASSSWDWWRENPYRFDFFDGDIYSYPTLESPNRSIITIYTCGPSPASSVEKDEKNRFGVFIQDSVSLGRRLTLNMGIRFDTSQGKFPRQAKLSSADPYGLFPVLPGLEKQSPYDSYELEARHVLSWTNLAPRIGFSYDLFGDGKTSFRGSWSRYNEYLMLQYFNRMNPIYPRSGSWYWHDDNFNKIPDPADSYKLVDLPDSPYVLDLTEVLDPDSSAPYTDELTLGIERELSRDFSLGLTLIYKYKHNIFEDVNDYGLGKEEAWKGYSPESPYWERYEFDDPGDDGLFGTEDDQRSFCYAELANSPGGLHWYHMNVGSGFRKYAALQLILQKRMSNRWQLLASFVWSNTWGNIGGGYAESSGASKAFDTPNSFVFAEGRLDFDRPLNIKMQSTVILPAEFMLSGYFNYLSGSPWARTVWVYIPEDEKYLYPGQGYDVQTEESGTRRKSSLTTLDLRLEKKFSLTHSVSVGAYLDVLNVLGWNYVDVFADPGGYLDYRDPDNPKFTRYGNFGDISGAYGSRIVKVSLRVTF